MSMEAGKILRHYLVDTLFDFSALNKPVFFYTPDEIMYKRGLYFSPRKKYPHITFLDYYDMANTIISIHKNKNSYQKILTYSDQIRKEYIQNTKNTTKDICNFIQTL